MEQQRKNSEIQYDSKQNIQTDINPIFTKTPPNNNLDLEILKN